MMKFLKIFFKITKRFTIILIMATVLAGGLFTYNMLTKHTSTLKNTEEIIEDYAPSLPTVLYDKHGKELDTLQRESRAIVRISDVPNHIKEAFMAIEDKEFYNHNGINVRRVIGALLANIKSGRTVQGGSSITQQLAKNAFLTQEKKLSRKIKEAFITIEIERIYTKDEILEKYLNEIYFGSGSYGIKTASKQFFKKNIEDINIAEGALLASIPNSPDKYNPRRKLENTISRQRLILSEMYKDKRITKEEYDAALNYKFVNEDNATEEDKKSSNTSIIYNREKKLFYKNPELTYIVEEKLKELFTEYEVYNGGLKVKTSFDLKIQKTAQEVFNNYSVFKNNKSLNGGMATIDPHTGHVISLVGGVNFKVGNFNRATMAKRQYGSSFKPFVYFAALQNGFEINTVVEDSLIIQGNWVPTNYGGRYGYNTTLVSALDRSVNTVSIKLLKSVGISNFIKMMSLIDDKLDVPNNLTSALGTVEGTPLQLSTDYAMFVNGGYKVEPVFITSVEDKYGNIVYTGNPKKEKLFNSADTSLVTFMLQSSVRSGSSNRARVLDKNKKAIDQGGKTGTTNNRRTIWYAGITADYVTTIYIGHDNNKPIKERIIGGTGVAPLWRNFYQKIINDGTYIPSKFSYLNSHIKNGDLVTENLDIRTGLIGGSSRQFVVRRGRMQVESQSKYKEGIASFFGGKSSLNYSNSTSKGNENDSLTKRLIGQ